MKVLPYGSFCLKPDNPEQSRKIFLLFICILMCLVHDIVEIDAGDTYAYDKEFDIQRETFKIALDVALNV